MAKKSKVILDDKTILLFAQKGLTWENNQFWYGDYNAVKVRRVLQLIEDYGPKPIEELRILDLGCEEGVYSLEFALQGAREVIALDARQELMMKGAAAAKRLGLDNIRFIQKDVRDLNTSNHEKVEVILFLGLLYHLNHPDIFLVMKQLYDLCEGLLIIDTHIALEAEVAIEHQGLHYEGKYAQEHADDDPEEVRYNRLLSSLDPLSFWFTRPSLIQLLRESGFSSVSEVYLPEEAFKPADRITLMAYKGHKARLHTYPWLNDLSDEEVARKIQDFPRAGKPTEEAPVKVRKSPRTLIKNLINACLAPLGLKISAR